MILEITKIGPSKNGQYACFRLNIGKNYVVRGIANLKNENLKVGTYDLEKDDVSLFTYHGRNDKLIHYTIN